MADTLLPPRQTGESFALAASMTTRPLLARTHVRGLCVGAVTDCGRQPPQLFVFLQGRRILAMQPPM
jgi:hypothetical protein